MTNLYRKAISDSEAKTIIDKHFPDLARNNIEEYEELWEDVIEASKAKTISIAMAILLDRGSESEIVLEIHRKNPWTPSPEEANLLRAFVPNFFNAVLLTFGDDPVREDGTLNPELLGHVEKVTKDIYDAAERERAASLRKA